MIDITALPGAASAPAQTAPHEGRKILKMEACNDRMAGSVPVWTDDDTARGAVAKNLTIAQADKTGGTAENFKSALAYAQNGAPADDSDDSFGFGDILDIVNPLQHIPIVSSLYRRITGDTIKPVSEIVGGGLFGGVAGLAGGVANVIVEKQTGRDITGNVIAMVNGDDSEKDDRSRQDFPGSTIALADLSREPITALTRDLTTTD